MFKDLFPDSVLYRSQSTLQEQDKAFEFINRYHIYFEIHYIKIVNFWHQPNFKFVLP